jgi:3-mercaptopyruvate sulfurtransferase SseA
MSNQYGANLVFDADKTANFFGSIGIDETKEVIIYGDYMGPS